MEAVKIVVALGMIYGIYCFFSGVIETFSRCAKWIWESCIKPVFSGKMLEERKIANIVEFNFFAITGKNAKVYIEKKGNKSFFYLSPNEDIGMLNTYESYYVGELEQFRRNAFDMEGFLTEMLTMSKRAFVTPLRKKWEGCNDFSKNLIFGNADYAQSNHSLISCYQEEENIFALSSKFLNVMKVELMMKIEKYNEFAKLLKNKLETYDFLSEKCAIFFSEYRSKKFVEIFFGETKTFLAKDSDGTIKSFQFVVDTHRDEEAKRIFSIVDEAVTNYEKHYGEALLQVIKDTSYESDLLTCVRFREDKERLFPMSSVNAFRNHCFDTKIVSIGNMEVALTEFADELLGSVKYEEFGCSLKLRENCSIFFEELLETIRINGEGKDSFELEKLVRKDGMRAEDLFSTSSMPPMSEAYDVRVVYVGEQKPKKQPMIAFYCFHRKSAVTLTFSLCLVDFVFDYARSVKREWNRLRFEEQYAFLEIEEIEKGL